MISSPLVLNILFNQDDGGYEPVGPGRLELLKAGSKTKIYEDIEQVKVKKVENGFDHGVDLPVKLPLMPLTTDLDQFEPIDEKKAKEGRSNIPAKDEGQRQSVPAKDLQEQDEKEKKRKKKR